jgi:hypothetical protein
MSKRDTKEVATGGFLSFSLVAQEIIAIAFACYSYQQGEMLLGASDATALMWCLTVVPVLVGAFDHR